MTEAQRVDVGAFLGGVGTIDLLIVLYFMAFFVLGFAQGTIRRLIGIGSILFSWFLAALLAEPLSNFLGDNWTQFAREYSYMIAFGTVFVVWSMRPGSTRSGENARWKSTPAVRPEPASRIGCTSSRVVPG